VPDEIRRYERIQIQLPCRLFVLDEGGGMRFEAFTSTRNLGLGGIFVESSFLLREGLELQAELSLPGKQLTVRAKVSHSVPLDHREWPSGMGLEFLGVDAHGRETLLRFFTPERYRAFYSSLTDELPHLKREMPLTDISLILNLWEEWKTSGDAAALPPPAALAPPRRGGGRARR